MIKDFLDIGMFATACLFLLAGFPVAFTLAGTALIFAALGFFFGVFDFSFFGALPSRVFGNAMWNEVLLAVPLFVFMGVMLERSRVAEELLDSMGMLFGTMRGGLGISVAIVGALLAASTGIVGATVVTMGLLSLPTMLKRGYSPSLASGTICAAGTLGQIIPPSIVLVLLGDQISNAYIDAQRTLGNWSPEPVSVGDLFAGALLPGLMLVGMYILYQFLVAWLKPEGSPAIPAEEINADGLWKRILHALVPPIVLIIAVLGSILSGIATPTEAAAVGAVGSILLAGLRVNETEGRPIYLAGLSLIVLIVLARTMDLRISRDEIPASDMVGIVIAVIACLSLAWGLVSSVFKLMATKVEGSGIPVMKEVMRSTMEISSMVFVILIGASVFSLVFRGLGGDDFVHEILSGLPGGAFGAMIAVMAVMFILGFFLDFIEITFVVVPIVAPVLLMMDLNPVWLGVMMAMNLQTSFLTPPFGFALFYLRGVAPPQVTTMHIYKGVVPFVIIQIIGLIILSLFPELATWLPKVIFG
ncbi:MAG: TRAP transporter large permease subunit [Rhodospirillales bacterium]|nr:TRAP transporter large permease subunit [Rhodospirillales bacterium]MCW8862459.1 TRAP transporter large permease subunit [Rhodospirillales bacterium]MCW8952516.1 TRAP transporter large permease subunit [Rhodospirillales bacterium]MCW8970032.1 TRAP transporter large permease subunit [Rhodospirillales bacterium]MCW9002158.1 TRAP transporter large permease subunit [Rhodospirillales bacterium]